MAWAGEKESQNWFHIAREYTEKWHHTQQIFFALDQSDQSLLSEKYYIPYLDTSMRALSFHYQKIETLQKCQIKATVAGKFNKVWWLQKRASTWSMIPFSISKPDAHILVPDHLAWRLLTKGISPAMAANLIHVEGNRELGDYFLTMVAVMA